MWAGEQFYVLTIECRYVGAYKGETTSRARLLMNDKHILPGIIIYTCVICNRIDFDSSIK